MKACHDFLRLDNPDVVRPAGPIDPQIGLLLVRSAGDKKPLGLLSNFALHLDTVGGMKWSADYLGSCFYPYARDRRD
jgi:hypothetical protein